MYVYIESEHNANGSLWTVGFYSPDGKWNPESDHETQESAAKRVHYLNGSKDSLELVERIKSLEQRLEIHIARLSLLSHSPTIVRSTFLPPNGTSIIPIVKEQKR